MTQLRPDNEDMSTYPNRATKRRIPDRAIRVLAVIPDVSSYRTESAETEKQQKKPRNTAKPKPMAHLPKMTENTHRPLSHTGRGRRQPRNGIWVVACMTACLVLAGLFAWQHLSKNRRLTTESPLQKSYMTRYANPPEEAATAPMPTLRVRR